jgi:ABC-type glycerol-3-phosphate transport system substrate-binding protein
MSRRNFLKMAATVSAASALAACAPAPAAGTKEEVKAAAAPPAEWAKTIHVWWWTAEPWKSAADRYNLAQDKIKLNLSEIGDAVFGDQKYMTAAAAGTGPDVAIQNRNTFMQFAAKKLYKPLDEFFQAAGLKKEDFFPIQYEESSWNGILYGIPLYTDTRHLYWNRKHVQEAGFSAPPQTWAELETYTEKINKKGDKGDFERMGFVPYMIGNSWMWMYGFLNEAPAISEDKRTILCDDPKWVEVLDWMVKFYDKHLGSFEIASAFNQGFATQTQDLFAQERVSMQITTDDAMNTYFRFPNLDFAMSAAPIPPNGAKSSWSCGWTFVITPEAKQPHLAWDFIEWVSGLDGWRAIAESEKAEIAKLWEREQVPGEPLYMPHEACYQPATDMLVKKYVSKLPQQRQDEYNLGIDCLKGWTHGCGTEMGVAALVYWVEIDNAARAALSHKMSPEEAMKQCKEKVQKATDEAWAAIEKQSQAFPNLALG